MRLLKRDGTAYTVEVSEAELTLLNNALNEVCNGIDVPEFETRLGATEAEAQSLLKRINSLLPTA
jgi:hypothetical protein